MPIALSSGQRPSVSALAPLANTAPVMSSETRSPELYITEACEQDLIAHGDTHKGVGYTRTADEARARYGLMLEVIRERGEIISVLDFGCGLAHLLDYINSRPELAHLRYTGLDLSKKYIAAARAKHPAADLLHLNILADDATLPDFDYVILNGVFNYRGAIPRDDMAQYWQRLITVAFRHCRRGIAFNVMSTLVDWERDDLFHLPFDEMAQFVGQNLSRHFIVRHDYPGYEYTTFVYRQPLITSPGA
jgi:SAM-dependent methyltransferase